MEEFQMTEQTTRPYAKVFTQASMTQQHQKDETDVNKIMKRYVKTGVIDHVNRHEGHYGDVPAHTYHEAMDQVIQANDMFQELPSRVRKRFENDPGKFLAFVQDPVNKDNLAQVLQPDQQARKPATTPDPKDRPPVDPPEDKTPPTEPAAASPAPAE
ncbi:internal scaffolding protein [Microviridae sp.]|nr:internal scaffolding protein [Microviridae sp.]